MAEFESNGEFNRLRELKNLVNIYIYSKIINKNFYINLNIYRS